MLIDLTAAGHDMFQASFAYLHQRHQEYFDARLTSTEQHALRVLLDKL